MVPDVIFLWRHKNILSPKKYNVGAVTDVLTAWKQEMKITAVEQPCSY